MKISHALFILLAMGIAAYLYLAGSMVGLVIVAGFLDGIHPCGFTVLLFFIAFLLSAKMGRGRIIAIGSLYILGVFVAYFGIGIGIMKAVSVFEPEIAAKVGAALLILVGGINVKDGLHGTTTLKIPKIAQPHISHFIEKGTLFAAFVAGVLVGLCAFPCVGGLYVSIITLISAKGIEAGTLGMLALYNFMFVLPLIITLGVASHEGVIEKIEGMEKRNRRNFKIGMGALMILFGAFILLGGWM